MNRTELEMLADRLRRAERALRWAGTTWLICIVVALVLGAGTQRAASQLAIQGTINARQFLVVDNSNTTRIEIGISREGNPGIWLSDASTKTRVHIGIDGGVRPELLFSNQNESERLRVGDKNDGQGGIWMFNQNGKPAWSAPRGMFGGMKP